jgi:hypothetical protein
MNLTHFDSYRYFSVISLFVNSFHLNPYKDTFRINVSYAYKSNHQYPDFIPIYQQIESFLAAHANDNEPWDNLRQHLTKSVVEKYPMLSSFSIDLT